jgi:hypothetical protein
MGRFLRMATILLVTLPLVGVAAGAKQARYRVAVVVDADLGLVLGGSAGGKWMNDAQASAYLRGGESYRVYSLTKRLGTATGTKPRYVDETPYVQAHVVHLTPEPRADAIAILGGWNALPRVPKSERTDQRVYQDIVRSVLNRKGISDPVVRITQVLRVDLEEDGVDEVLLSATSRPRERLFNQTEKGDYSLVLLRKVISGEPTTVVLDGGYQRTAPPEDQPPLIAVYRIKAVLDANGDGTQEVFVAWECYEGEGTGVYAVKKGRAVKILEQGVGA